jgi:hypothetical protein
MPAVVRGLARVAMAPRASKALRSRVLAALINRWKDLLSGNRIWGPAAATTVIEGLRDLAAHRSANRSEKLEVVRALGLRLADPPAMRAIAEILGAARRRRPPPWPCWSCATGAGAFRRRIASTSSGRWPGS